MYRIFVDDKLLYDPRVDSAVITSGALTLELNTAGSLKIGIPATNPVLPNIQIMKSIITLYDDNRVVFRGRPYSPVTDLTKHNLIDCEGELAFLNDSVFEPFEYYGDVETLFRRVIANHNSQVGADKRFYVGEVTARNKTIEGKITRSSIDYLTTWEILKSKFFGTDVGGILRIRHEDGDSIIDYLADSDETSNQTIEQAVNVISAEKEVTPDNLATVIIPLGAKLKDAEGEETDERLNIRGVNGGKLYLEDAEGIAIYGRITRVVIHDGITVATNLLTAGREDLQNALGVDSAYKIKAADLSRAGYNVSPFMIGSYVPVKVRNLDVAQTMLIRKMSLNLLSPESNAIEIGASAKTLTSNLTSIGELQTAVTETSASIVALGTRTERAIEQVREETSEEIQTTAEAIRTETTEEIGTSITPLEIIAPKTITLNGVFAGKLQDSVLKFTIPTGKTIRDIATTDIAITGEIRVIHSTGAETITLADLSYVTYDTMISVIMATELTLADQPVSVEPTTEITIAFTKGS